MEEEMGIVEFNKFFLNEKKRITKLLKEKGCYNFKFNKGYFYFSGFFTTINNKYYYFSTTDLRFEYKIYFRRAMNYNDYNGLNNIWIDPTNDEEFLNLKFLNYD